MSCWGVTPPFSMSWMTGGHEVLSDSDMGLFSLDGLKFRSSKLRLHHPECIEELPFDLPTSPLVKRAE